MPLHVYLNHALDAVYDHLKNGKPLPPEPAPPDASALLRPLAEQVAELEQRAIAAAMQTTGGNKLAAARLLGISRATLYERLDARQPRAA